MDNNGRAHVFPESEEGLVDDRDRRSSIQRGTRTTSFVSTSMYPLHVPTMGGEQAASSYTPVEDELPEDDSIADEVEQVEETQPEEPPKSNLWYLYVQDRVVVPQRR